MCLLKRLLFGPTTCAVVFGLLSSPGLLAQRTFESKGNVVYEDARGKKVSLGIGFSPVLTSGGRVAFLQGREFSYGEDFDCANRRDRNWVALYDPVNGVEKVLFDRVVPFEGGKWKFCIFEQMELSHDGSLLYLVSPVYATSGSLAIVTLSKGKIKYVPGVDTVYVIQTGPHYDELIYIRRVLHKGPDGGEYPAYPFIHAAANGQPIREISDEFFTEGGHDKVPLLRQYLRRIGGTIVVNGETLP